MVTLKTQNSLEKRFGRRTKLKFNDIDISIKSQDGFSLFNSIIATLNKSNFSLTLPEKDKILWNTIINHFNKANANA